MTRRSWFWLAAALAVLILGWWYTSMRRATDSAEPQPPSARRASQIVINEAVRTLLYLPLYHAEHSGFFDDEGLDVRIDTGGTATNSFAAMVSGEAHFSQADPMYVPISREKEARTKVVAQVVGRIAVWAVAMDSQIQSLSATTLRGATVSTHPAPMTAYTYTVKAARDLGLDPETDLVILQSTPGTEIIPLLRGDAQFAMTLEPNTSKAIAQGAHVVYSYPDQLGDQVFTGLMTTEDYISSNRETVLGVVRAYQRALTSLRVDREAAIESAAHFFPELEEGILTSAIARLVEENVFPASVEIPEDSWRRAMQVRLDAGDLRAFAPRSDSCALDLTRAASQSLLAPN